MKGSKIENLPKINEIFIEKIKKEVIRRGKFSRQLPPRVTRTNRSDATDLKVYIVLASSRMTH